MSASPLAKIDRFFIILVAILLALSLFVFFTFKNIFSAIVSAYEVGQETNAQIRLDKDKLKQAETKAFERETVPLEIR